MVQGSRLQDRPKPSGLVREDGTTASETALTALRYRILDGSLAAGAKLHQSQLASEFGMSRIPVRDAIRALTAEGLVTQHPHRTAVVSPVGVTDLAELYEIRIAVEPRASALAVPRLVPAEVSKLRALLESLGELDQPERWHQAHDLFHSTLYRRSGRPRMISLLDRARAQTRRYTWIRLDRATEEVEAEHRLILGAVERSDTQSVAALVQAHLTAGYNIVSRRLQALGGAQPGEPMILPTAIVYPEQEVSLERQP